MATNTLIGTDDDLGDVVSTHVFDVRLARSLLLASTLVVIGSVGAGVATWVADPLGGGVVAATLVPIFLIGVGVFATWGVVLAISRLQRRRDLFVVHRFGLAWHRGEEAVRTRWVDIALVTHTGSDSGSTMARWNGNDYVCRIVRREGMTLTFDNYVVEAAALGRDIERRALV